MPVYLVMLAISIFFGFYASNVKPYPALRQTYRICAVLSAAPFVLVTVLRWRVGTDWTYVYEPYLYYIRHGIAEFSEAGFNFIYRVFAAFTDDAWLVIAFVGLLTVVFFFAAIYDQSCMLAFSILLFVIINKYFTALNQIRQMLAMSLFVYSLKYVYRRDWKRYFLLNLLGWTIHNSSLMYLPLYFLYGVRVTAKRAIVFFAGAILAYPALRILFAALISATDYNWYLESAFSQNDFYLLGFLVTLLFTLLHIFYLYRYPQTDSRFEFWSIMMILSTVFLLFSASIPQILRVSEGLSIVQLFSLPWMLKKEENQKIRIAVWLLIVGIYTGKLLYDVYVNKWYDIIPYRTVFSR